MQSQWSKHELYSSKYIYSAGLAIDSSNNIYFAKQKRGESYIKKILRVCKPIVAHIIEVFGKQQNQVIPREIIKQILRYCSDFYIIEINKFGSKISCITAGINGKIYLGTSPGVVKLTTKGTFNTIELVISPRSITRNKQTGEVYATGGNHIKKMSGREVESLHIKESSQGDYAGIAVDKFQNIYVAVPQKGRARKISPDGEIVHFDRFVAPTYLAADDNGNIYVAEEREGSIFMISPEGVVSKIVSLKDSFIFGLAVSNDGNVIYVINTGRIWKLEKKKE